MILNRAAALRTATLSALTVLLSAAWSPAAPIDIKTPPQGRFSDEWLEIYIGEGKAGYAHAAMTRRDDLIDTEMTFHLVLGRVDQPVKVDLDQKVTETLEGVPVSFSTDTNMSVMKSSTRGAVKDGRVEIISSQLGMDQKQEFDFPKGALMAWGVFRESMIRGFKPGTEYEIHTYAPELRLDDAVNTLTRVGDWEEFSHKGQTHKGQKVTVELQTPMGKMELVSWVDRDGMPVKSKMPVPGLGDMILVVSDQKTAMADFVPAEFFMNTVIKADKPIDYKKANRITYRVISKDPKVPIGDLPEAGSQQIVARAADSIDLVVERQKHVAKSDGENQNRDRKGAEEQNRARKEAAERDTDRKAEAPREAAPRGDQAAASIDNQQSTINKSNPPDFAEFLSGNLMMNIADPKLVELAKQAAGGEANPFALGDKLRQFVTEYIADKNLNIGFATASEVARNREGDCSEHGVLLAALGRINGLPSRVAVGLAYVPIFGGQDDIFGYHMWTQFYIDNRWIDFDAALRETDCSPIRITFATSSLQNSGIADLSLPLINKLGAIDIKVLKIE